MCKCERILKRKPSMIQPSYKTGSNYEVTRSNIWLMLASWTNVILKVRTCLYCSSNSTGSTERSPMKVFPSGTKVFLPKPHWHQWTGQNNSNTCQYSAIQFNSSTNYIFLNIGLNQHLSTIASTNLSIIIFIKEGFRTAVLDYISFSCSFSAVPNNLPAVCMFFLTELHSEQHLCHVCKIATAT